MGDGGGRGQAGRNGKLERVDYLCNCFARIIQMCDLKYIFERKMSTNAL